MRKRAYSRLAAKSLIAVGLMLAAVAGNASSTAVGSGASAEVLRLEATWGPQVVRTAQVIPSSHLILIGTRDPALIASANPQRWLGSRLPVVVMSVNRAGAFSTLSPEKCGFSHDNMSADSEM
jgi:hypothetical protein